MTTQGQLAVAKEPRHLSRSAAGGRVVFVGTGPGDPDLLTLAAVAALGDADTILLDRESLAAVFDHPSVRIAKNVRIESVDTFAGPHERAAHIATIIEAGRRIVRLVEGDPFLDGGVAREAQACVGLGIDFEVVPGVSSLTAVPEYAGIPLDDSNGVSFVSCTEEIDEHCAAGWPTTGTVVVSTRAGLLESLVDATTAAGRPADEPVVLTTRGGSHDQVSTETTLGGLVAAARAARLDDADHIHLMLGHLATPGARDDLDWFETKPLFGWRVLVPKTKDAIESMVHRLHGFGAQHHPVPTLSVEQPRTPQQMDKAIRGLVEGRYEWVIFTSVNSVRAVREKFEAWGLDARAFSGLRVAAVCPATAEALQQWGIDADLVPQGEPTARGLAAEFPAFDEALDPINRVFLPRADIATETLAAELAELGWEVEDVTAYRTVRAAPPPADVREAIKTGKFDAVVFTSSSTVRNLVGIAGKPHHATIVAAIGPATAKTCEEHGLRVDVVSPRPSMEALVDALAQFATDRRAELVARGAAVTRPSERRPGARRRT